MSRTIRTLTALTLAGATVLGLSACTSAAQTASENVSTAADNFEVNRRIVGINGITDQILFEVEGACSITRDGDLVVLCKTGPNEFKKHYLGLSQNVTFVSTQLGPVKANEFHTRVILRPTTILPDFDMAVG